MLVDVHDATFERSLQQQVMQLTGKTLSCSRSRWDIPQSRGCPSKVCQPPILPFPNEKAFSGFPRPKASRVTENSSFQDTITVHTSNLSSLCACCKIEASRWCLLLSLCGLVETAFEYLQAKCRGSDIMARCTPKCRQKFANEVTLIK